MNKKYILGLAIGMFLIVGTIFVGAYQVLDNGDIIITEQELLGLSNQQIANYMVNSLTINSVINEGDSIGIYYNIVHIEPTHEGTYRVFSHKTRTEITYSDAEYCLLNYNLNTCVQYLVYNNNEIIIDLGNNLTRTFTPTYLQAYRIGVEQYQNVIDMRDNLTNNPLQTLIGGI